MSLSIDVDRVMRVMLADGWHEVARKSFDLDSYEFNHESACILRGGAVLHVCSTGFRFTDPATGRAVFGPVTAILAVECWQ